MEQEFNGLTNMIFCSVIGLEVGRNFKYQLFLTTFQVYKYSTVEVRIENRDCSYMLWFSCFGDDTINSNFALNCNSIFEGTGTVFVVICYGSLALVMIP